jgi:D-lactate dehydrogenase (cytochrome)
MVDVSSTRESVRRHLAEVESVLSSLSPVAVESTVDSARMDELTRARRSLYPALLARRSPGQLVVSMDIVVPPSELAPAIGEVRAAAAAAGFEVVVPGHVGDGNFHTLVPVLPEDYSKAEAYAERLVEKALELGGTCTAEHGVGLRKKKFLPKEHGSSLEWMRRLKALFDPEGLLNPGKVLDISPSPRYI